MSYPPGSIETVEYTPNNPRAREDFEINIRTLVSILNADKVSQDTITLVNEKICQHINFYHNPSYVVKV